MQGAEEEAMPAHAQNKYAAGDGDVVIQMPHPGPEQ